MKFQFFLLGILCILFVTAVTPAQPNPFFDRPPGVERDAPNDDRAPDDQRQPPHSDDSRSEDAVQTPAPAPPRRPSAIGRITADVARTITIWQRDLNRRLATTLRTVSQEGFHPGGWLGVLGFAFLFGILHAVLPGHRKSVLISYCIADRARVGHGIALGFLFALMHAISAALIVFVTVSLVEISLGSTIARISHTTQVVSSLLLLAIGAIFCVIAGREILHHRRAGGACCHAELRPPDADTVEATAPDGAAGGGTRRWIAVVLSTGIIPCPITTALLLFAVSVNAVAMGIAAVVALSAGLGVALAGLAVLTIFVKERVLALLEKRTGHLLHAGVELVGSFMIFLVGAVTLMVLV